MLRSLVGSEMCIRDRHHAELFGILYAIMQALEINVTTFLEHTHLIEQDPTIPGIVHTYPTTQNGTIIACDDYQDFFIRHIQPLHEALEKRRRILGVFILPDQHNSYHKIVTALMHDHLYSTIVTWREGDTPNFTHIKEQAMQSVPLQQVRVESHPIFLEAFQKILSQCRPQDICLLVGLSQEEIQHLPVVIANLTESA